MFTAEPIGTAQSRQHFSLDVLNIADPVHVNRTGVHRIARGRQTN